MEFARRKVRGRTQKTYREWTTEDGHYRITWRNEVAGVRVRAGYHACVLSINQSGHTFWSFCTRRTPFKRFDLAVEACEKNHRLWSAFCAIADTERKGRADRVRALDAKAVIGSGAAAHKVMSVLPVWVQAKAEPFLLRLLFPVGRRQADDDECDTSPSNGQSDPSSHCSHSETPESISPSEIEPASTGHVSTATESNESTTPTTRRARSKATSSATESRARPAKGRAKARKRPSKKSTAKRSKSTSTS